MLPILSKKSSDMQNFSSTQEIKKRISFSVGTPLKRAKRIIPIFLPFMGCPCHCVFCAQDKQTGKNNQESLSDLLEEMEKIITAQGREGELELAFYGGTFTAIKEEYRKVCLNFLKKIKSLGFVSLARCSTRPDRLDLSVLKELRDSGIDLIELGIQSFSSEALSVSRRGYSAEQAAIGCNTVLERGFLLGIQLLPGMPGSNPELFLQDVEKALSFKPACIRFYPCLVPDGTELAEMYKKGRYLPWSMEETISTLGKGLQMAWEAEIPVVRLSVAPEASFDQIILAGPRHPALGALIQSEALYRTVRDIIEQNEAKPASLTLPKKCQGYVFGNRGMSAQCWESIGFTKQNIRFTDTDKGEIIFH